MSNQNLDKAKHVVIEFFSIYTSREYDKIPSLIDSDYRDNSPAQARSPADVIHILKLVADIFPDLSCEILDIFGENGDVAVRLAFSGTHSGTYADVPASGKFISWEALENFRVQNDKIIESWGYWPDSEMLKQMK
jgi:steroid delta-isomerase-like uncharacterized protein